jgi:hypothetical protein
MKVGQYKDSEQNGSGYRDTAILNRASSNSFDKIMDGQEDDDSITETSAMVEQQPEQEKGSTLNRILCCSGILLLLGGLGVGSYFLAINNRKNTSKSMATAATGAVFCQPVISDIHEPFLELHISAGHLNHKLDSVEVKKLEHAITDGYNAASGGCTDMYERFMVGSLLKNHNLTSNADEENNSDFSVEFNGMKTLILEFETVISCQGCPYVEAFSTNYPSSYAPVDDTTEANTTRQLLEDPLDASVIMTEIEKRIKQVLPQLGDITDASIRMEGSTMATMKLRGSSYVSSSMSYCQ